MHPVPIAATLSQQCRTVGFILQSAVEKEATAIIESKRKWRLFIIGRKFTIVTDQEAMFHV